MELNKSAGKSRSRALSLWLPLVLGILLIAGSFAVLTVHDRANAARVARQTLTVMQLRISRYENYAAAEKAKSLVRLLDKTAELSRCLVNGEGDDPDFMDQYAYDQRLTGALVLDGGLSPVLQTAADGDSYAFLQDVLRNDNIRDIVSYPKKSYLMQFEKDGHLYDFAAVARRGEPGVVAAYCLKAEPSGVLADYSLASLFESDSFNLNGIVAVTDEKTVVASNLDGFQGKTVEECLGMKESAAPIAEGALTHIHANGKAFYASTARAGDYYLYVIFPVLSVYSTRHAVLGYSIALCILVWLLFYLLRRRAERENLSQLEKQYRIIQAVSNIYSTTLLVYLDRDRLEALRTTEELSYLMAGPQAARAALDDLCRTYIAPDYREEHRVFTEFSTLPDRLKETDYLTQNYQDIHGRWHLSAITPQRYDKAGRLIAVLFLSRDVTEDKKRELDYQERLRRTAEEAERANLAKTDFLRRMSHDVRTPINGIRGMVEISRYCADDPARQEDCRAKIMEASGFLLDLVNNVLDMNKLESGQTKLEERPFDLRAVLRELAAITEVQAAEKGVALTFPPPRAEHWQLVGSPLHLRQLLQNIVANAIKYNRPNGTVTFTCQEYAAGDGAARFRFVCADTGIGMSEEFQAHAFEAFAQEHSAVRTSYSGTGLGLPIAKELAQQMGGEIHFVSKEGVGTTFTVTLPFRIGSAPAPAPAAPLPTGTPIKGVNILLVEDNAMNREITRFFLERHGAAVTEAVNGKEGLDAFLAAPPGHFHIVLMDVMMPVMNGLDAAKAIRSAPRPDAGTVPIFAMTANAFSDDVERSLAAGMNIHIPKPLDTEKLLAAIIQYCRRETPADTPKDADPSGPQNAGE